MNIIVFWREVAEMKTKYLALAAVCALLPATGAFAADEDLIGLWNNGVMWGSANAIAVGKTGDLFPNAYGINNTNARTSNNNRYVGGERFVIAEQDPGVADRAEGAYPLYKPEYWDEVQIYNYLHKSDPTKQYIESRWRNLPLGEPELGPPQLIAAGPRPNELFFIFGQENQWKYIPTDCRPHDEGLSYDAGFLGHAVGCWDGDTLVVTSKGFTTDTWIRDFGMIHSADMVITERFTPNADGTQIHYVSVVEDPMLLEPFTVRDQNMNRQTDPMRFLAEDYPYQENNQLEVGGGC
jgi:hypothetical protein